MLNSMAGSFTALEFNQAPHLKPHGLPGPGAFFSLCVPDPSTRGFVRVNTGRNFDFHPVQKTDIVNTFDGLWISGHLGDNA